jgi:hypothetical protein
MSDFATHKDLLATDDTYRAVRGLGPVAAGPTSPPAQGESPARFYVVGDPDPTPRLDLHGDYCRAEVGALATNAPGNYSREWYCTWAMTTPHAQHVAGFAGKVRAVRMDSEITEAEWEHTEARRTVQRAMDDGTYDPAPEFVAEMDQATLAVMDQTALNAGKAGASEAQALLETAPQSTTADGIDRGLGEYLDALKAQRKELARLDKLLGVEVDRVEEELVDQYVNAGKDVEQFGDRIGTLRPTIWARKVDETVTGEQVADALVADGLGHLVTPPSYNSQQLSAFLRDLEEERKPIPTHLAKVIEATERYKVTFTTRRETRARRRIKGTPSSVLDEAVDTAGVGASGD